MSCSTHSRIFSLPYRVAEYIPPRPVFARKTGGSKKVTACSFTLCSDSLCPDNLGMRFGRELYSTRY